MATKKAGGTAKNLTDSNPKYLGIKLPGGAFARAGAIIVRQRGTRYMAGKNVSLGKDHTLFSLVSGIVSFKDKRKKRFDGSTTTRKIVQVEAK